MKTITFHFDFISPFAYLAFEKLPEALKGLSYRVDYRPVLFAGLLKHHGQLGPAEIPPKRDWTYRQVLWLAHAEKPVTLIDRELFRFEEIWAAAGHPHGVFKLRPQDLERLTGAPVADVTKEPAA